MKAPGIVLLAAVVLCGLGGLGAGMMWRTEATRAAALEQELAQSKAENAKLSAGLADATDKAQALESESAQLRAARALSGARLEPAAASTPAENESKPKEKGGILAQMFKNPQMRKLMAAQQAAALRGLYSDYLKQAHLTPDQTERFFQLLQDRQMALMDSSADAMSGGQVDLKAATAAANTASDALKELLGPEQFAQYQDFEKTLGVRVQVQQLNQQLTGEGMPLQDYQNTALIQIMGQENAARPGFGNSAGGAQQALNMSPAEIDQYSQQVEATNQRIYNRAMSVLTAPQLTAFASFQKNMATAQIAGLKMAQQMFNGNQ
jgi:hypothetical protein